MFVCRMSVWRIVGITDQLSPIKTELVRTVCVGTNHKIPRSQGPLTFNCSPGGVWPESGYQLQLATGLREMTSLEGFLLTKQPAFNKNRALVRASAEYCEISRSSVDSFSMWIAAAS